ncbi:MAG TPA: hydrogenase maturation protease [Thermoplasmata archaeon]|nr:hydrogenase maturation protease [Thermoplasmata archaeon]
MALVILGLGNDLLGDDGIGLLAADALRGCEGPEVAVRTSVQSGLYLLEHLQGFEDAIVVDSVAGDHPGTIRELRGADLAEMSVPSAHYVGLPEALGLARASGLSVPHRLRIFGVEIDIAQRIGSPPGSEVVAALPRLVAAVVTAAREWGYAVPDAPAPEVPAHA